MDSCTLKAYAKINIGLDVTGKTDNGYHLLKTVMQQVDLYDVITIERAEKGINFSCDSKDVPSDDTNLAVKAAKLMTETYGIKEGVNISLNKNIPIAAGMAGGSTDGAAVIIGMNKVFDLDLTMQEMIDTGVKIGADIPFCIQGGCAIAEGIGEKLRELDNRTEMYTLIAKPPINVSTVHVYKTLKWQEVIHPDMDRVIKGIMAGSMDDIVAGMGNVLESVTCSEYDIINELKKAMLDIGASGSLMSGSGPTVFGLFKTKEEAMSAEKGLKDLYPDVFVKATGIIR
ncbi:MAG: 4-(cytidine 5'-diphospho)-2-C-methyl-D-erythritol kinase [Lachnospiraceae bacterium]|nr:4-(cytidine 5'-diphospho)-2-C-methyl-D-erythritol kinase [Lachnospiraceae bacterium]